jgi:uncharacterized protein
MKIAIAGATGLVGSHLVPQLLSAGHQVVILARNPSAAQARFAHLGPVEIVSYRPLETGDWQRSINGCDGVVNLAGEPIAAKKWTPEQKQALIDSRRRGTELLVAAINQAQPRPSVLVNASAIGYYGTSDSATFTETSPAGDDFLAEICQAWEAAAHQAPTRQVILRLGIVLSGQGGALAKMLPAFKMFMGGPIGSGQQWFSWIQVEDVVALIIRALEDGAMEGTFNATAPQPVTMNQLCQVLGQVMSRPSWVPVPNFVLDTMLGEGATVVLDGQRVLPQALGELGFTFKYPELAAALRACLD